MKDSHSKLRISFMAGTLGHGGAERQLFYIVRALCQCGVVPRILCLDRRRFWEGQIQALGAAVTWIGRSQSRIVRLLRIITELRRNPPDIFQSQHFFANAYAALAALPLGVKAIGAMRNEGEAEVRRTGAVGGWVNLHWPPIIAANTRLAIRQSVARGRAPSCLYFLPNVVDLQQFQPAHRHPERSVTLLAVGRLVRQKRFDRFIGALARLRTECEVAISGWIAGPAPRDDVRIELENQAVRLGLVPGCLRFLGGISDMPRLYQQADVCVLTSDYEGTPNVLLEAMACGLPVVSTRVGGVPDIVEHTRTGLLVEPNDADGLVAALKGLVRDTAARIEMGCRAREYVEQNHSLERLPDYLDGLYRLALPRPAWEAGAVEGTSVLFP